VGVDLKKQEGRREMTTSGGGKGGRKVGEILRGGKLEQTLCKEKSGGGVSEMQGEIGTARESDRRTGPWDGEERIEEKSAQMN